MTLLKRLKAVGWRRWAPRIALGLPIGAVVVWSAVNLAHGDPPGALWAPSDLPPVPDATGNGWHYLHEHQDEFRGARTDAIARLVRSVLAGDGVSPPPTEEDTAAADAEHATDRVAHVSGLCEEALAKPTFADACPLDFATRCPSLEIMLCHRLACYRVLQAVARGQWGSATQRVDRLLAQGAAHVRSARSLVGMHVALRDLRESLKLTALVVEWARDVGEPAHVEQLQRRVTEIATAGADVGPAIIGEYLREVHGLVLIQRGEIESEGALPGFFFDAGATLTELNRIYALTKMRGPAAAMRGARAVPALPDAPYSSHFGWWVRNPLGKLYLDAVLPPRRVFEDLERARAELVAEQERVRARVESP